MPRERTGFVRLLAPPAFRCRAFVAWRVALGLGVLAACTGCSAESRLSVHVVGNHLVDGQGKPVRLLGVDRSGAEYACVSPPDQHLGTFAGPTGRQAIASMAAWRINAVRVPLNEDCWLGINGAPRRYSSAHYRNVVAAYVARLHRAGLYVVLDLHWSAPGTTRAVGQQPMADLDHTPAFWSSVASAFKSDPAVIFDIYSEPHGISWACWRDGCRMPEGWLAAGMQTLVNAVRSTGARQPIIATGMEWGTDLSLWLEYRPHDPAHQLAAAVHVYDFTSCRSPACWSRTFQPVARAVPVVATELGQRACSGDFMGRFLDWADAIGVSYIGWSWNPAGCAAPSLIRSWDGQPTASGARLRDHLITVSGNRKVRRDQEANRVGPELGVAGPVMAADS
jgi:endoglucanase